MAKKGKLSGPDIKSHPNNRKGGSGSKKSGGYSGPDINRHANSPGRGK